VAEQPSGELGASILGHGAPGRGIILRALAIATAWNVQGDDGNPAFAAATAGVIGAALPSQPNAAVTAGDWTILWIGPRSWLLIGMPTLATPTTETFAAHRDALNAAGGALFDVSASRVAFEISGMAAASVINKTCPLDLHPRAFPVGRCAQSVIGHIGALLYKTPAIPAPSFVVMVARSMAMDAWDALSVSAAECGYDVRPSGVFGGLPSA
jgi:sarcosine oxidase, subunit gamma